MRFNIRHSPDGIMAYRLSKGLTVTSLAQPAVFNGSYALDDVTELASMARDVAAGLGLPGGLATVQILDLGNQWHTLTAVQVVRLYKAIRDVLAAIRAQALIAKSGGAAHWPTQTVTIA